MPVIVRAVLTGGGGGCGGHRSRGPLLAAANLKVLPGAPWSVPVMALYLWSSGEWRRRTNLRANRLSEDVWAAALLAGTSAWGRSCWVSASSIDWCGCRAAGRRPLAGPGRDAGLRCSLMGSVVAGLVEEASFRGYMQGPIERRHGPVSRSW